MHETMREQRGKGHEVNDKVVTCTTDALWVRGTEGLAGCEGEWGSGRSPDGATLVRVSSYE